MLFGACTKLQALYETNDPEASVTAALATKVFMGALGCTPAYDQCVVGSIKESKPRLIIRSMMTVPLGLSGSRFPRFQNSILITLKLSRGHDEASRILLPPDENPGYGALEDVLPEKRGEKDS